MCTVVVQVPASLSGSVRLLAVRDEDSARPWDPPGEWWPNRPGVIGVRDRRAGGAWLATRDDRLSVLLNRAETSSPNMPASSRVKSRGMLVLDDLEGSEISSSPETAGFNLVSTAPGSTWVTSWNGQSVERQQLSPGMHMIAHHGVDDSQSARIKTWLPEFRKLENAGDNWRDKWLELLSITAALPITDDRAIIRDNHVHGYPTASLLVCIASISATDEAPARVSLESASLKSPAAWQSPTFEKII